MAYEYGIKEVFEFIHWLKSYFLGRINTIRESARESKFVFFLQCFNVTLLFYLYYYLLATTVNEILPTLNLGLGAYSVIFLMFLLFVLSTLSNLIGRSFSLMILFKTNLPITLAITLSCILLIQGWHMVVSKIKSMQVNNE